jgi:hypothetical protein
MKEEGWSLCEVSMVMSYFTRGFPFGVDDVL